LSVKCVPTSSVGTGPEAAGKLAGDMKQKGNIWLLWPKGAALPQVPDAPL
jgi:membrane-bound lytic murein transglycosylase A